jgi:murein DD-endopeptidase MepM/ murein hydrolase activator NlpD
MNKMILLFCFLSFLACNNGSQKTVTVSVQTAQQDTIVVPDSTEIKTLAVQFDSINTLVRDGKIEKAQALKELQQIVPALHDAYNRLQSDTAKQRKSIFPVAGYTSNAIGGKNGEGYISNGYDYFAGNKHGGHPAHDIFIYDRNQDSKEDRSGKHVNVLSVSDGIVVALEHKWDTTSVLRGGKYIWIYASAENALYYYAHNADVYVTVGCTVIAGDTIATVGRTGLNAFKKRSPTHLHFMKLKFDKDYYPKPVNTYNDLLKYEVHK